MTGDRFVVDTSVRGIVEETDMITSIECGFRFEMFTGTATLDDGSKVEVTAASGGGGGSPWLTFSVGDRFFRIDARPVAQALVEYVEENPREVSHG